MWIESSWAFLESYTADDSWIVRLRDGGQRGEKRAHTPLHDSDHDDVVRIFVALSCEL